MPKSLAKDPVMTDPKIWMGMAFVLIPMLLMFFKPTLWECLGFYLVDVVAYAVCVMFDVRLFHRFSPESKTYYPRLDPAVFQLQGLAERQALYQSILRFPRVRSLFNGLISTVKVMPSFAFVFLVWSHQESPLVVLAKCLGICAFSFSFLIGMTYLGYHNIATQWVQEIHQKADWSEVFKNVEIGEHQRLYNKFETLCAVSIWVFWTFMLTLILTTPDLPRWFAVVQVIYVSLAALYYSVQLMAANRKQIMQGLDDLVGFHDSTTDLTPIKSLALSTSPNLAHYQRTLNGLIEKNAESEREVHRWILRKAEDSRYLQLGRLTGLLVHDLMTPLTVMHHSLSVLDRNMIGPSNTNLERFRFSLDQTIHTVKSLRDSIRDRSTKDRQGSIGTAHETAKKMALYLHVQARFADIPMECDVPDDARVTIPQSELNQIFINLYSNALSNLLKYEIMNPHLSVHLLRETADNYVLLIRDNGTGLSMETFRHVTEEPARKDGLEGIGLKLTKRLIELYGGSLRLLQPEDGVGALFQMVLCKKIG